jgi:hypothetical protein
MFIPKENFTKLLSVAILQSLWISIEVISDGELSMN